MRVEEVYFFKFIFYLRTFPKALYSFLFFVFVWREWEKMDRDKKIVSMRRKKEETDEILSFWCFCVFLGVDLWILKGRSDRIPTAEEEAGRKWLRSRVRRQRNRVRHRPSSWRLRFHTYTHTQNMYIYIYIYIYNVVKKNLKSYTCVRAYLYCVLSSSSIPRTRAKFPRNGSFQPGVSLHRARSSRSQQNSCADDRRWSGGRGTAE